MKTSKEMQLKILDKMRENVESGVHHYFGIETEFGGEWRDMENDEAFDFLDFGYRIKGYSITINGIEIPKPLTEGEMKNLDKDGVYFPCSNPAMYSVEGKKYCILNRAWENVGYKSMEEAMEASKSLFGIKC